MPLESRWRPWKSRRDGSNPLARRPRSRVLNPSLQELESRTLLSVTQPIDPGFEVASAGSGASSFVYTPTGSPWNFAGLAGVTGNGSGFTNSNPGTVQGSQALFIQDGGYASQSVSLNAGTYVISLASAQRGMYNNGGQTIQVRVDNTLVGAVTPVSSSYAYYSTASFPVSAGMHTITLAGLNPKGNDNTAFVDDLALVAPSPLSDPGFELPALGSGATAYQYAPAGSPWTFNGTGITGNGSNFTSGNPNAPQGGQVAFIQGTGSVSQTATFAAGTYVVTFQAAQRGNAKNQAQAFQVQVDGKAFGSVTPASSSYAQYSSGAFTVTAGSHTVTIAGLSPGGGDNTGFVDQVAVTSPPVVQDGDFSSPSLGSGASAYAVAPSGTPWTFFFIAGISGNATAYTNGNPASPAGAQVAFLQFTGSISQAVSLGAGTYAVSFQAAQRGNAPNQSQAIQVLIDGKAVSTVTPASTSYASYTSAAFTVAAGAHTLTLAGLDPSGGDNTALVANVSVAAASPIADPGFESSSVGTGLTAYLYDPTNTPWTYSGYAGVAGNGSRFTYGNGPSPQGSEVAFLQITGAVSQSLTFAAGSYVVTFKAAQRSNQNIAPQVIQVAIDGKAVGTVTPTSMAYALYSSASFSVTAGAHTLTLSGLNPSGGDNTAFVDDLAIATAPVVQDGDFSSPSLGSGASAYAVAPSGTPWTFFFIAGISGNATAYTNGNPASPAGAQVAFLQFTGSISQAVSLGAGTYAVSFQAAQRGNAPNQSQAIQVLVDGKAVSTVTPAGTSYASYTSATFTVAAGAHTLTLAGLDPKGGDNTAFVTNVTVTTPTAIADPGFESPQAGAGVYLYTPTNTPWAYTSGAGVAGNGSDFTKDNPNAPQGSQVAFLQQAGSISQVVSLAAGTYTLDIDAAQRTGFNNGGQAIGIYVDGVIVSILTPISTSYVSYVTNSFTVAQGNHTIALAGLNPRGGDNTALIDAITIQ